MQKSGVVAAAGTLNNKGWVCAQQLPQSLQVALYNGIRRLFER